MQHWWQKAVFYQVYLRSFKDSNSDGVGDLAGIIDNLDYIKGDVGTGLGADAIWINPFYPSPMKDFGYDVCDYCDVHPLFGDLETFERLIEAAHERNIKVVIDWVPNHTSSEHPWFLDSKSSTLSEKREWYIWKDPSPDGSFPNNWGSCFGGPAWTFDEKTGQYYFHQFDSSQPDLNWRNPEVQDAMFDTLRFWLDRGVDGFRMDVVYMIWKHPDMPDQACKASDNNHIPLNNFYERQIQNYSCNFNGIHSLIARIRAVVDEYPDTVTIGELWLPLEERVKYYGKGDEFQLPFNFGLFYTGGFSGFLEYGADNYRNHVEHFERLCPASGWPNYVVGNHDIPRLVSRVGSEDKARVVALLLLTIRGTPTIYMGDELGLEEAVIAPERIQDPAGKAMGASHNRDGCRTPLPWSNTNFGGFSDVEPWLQMPADWFERNVESMQGDERSIWSFYSKLIHYRQSHDSLMLGDYQTKPSPRGTYAYTRRYRNEIHLVLLNLSDSRQQFEIQEGNKFVLGTHAEMEPVSGNFYSLAAHSGVLLLLN